MDYDTLKPMHYLHTMVRVSNIEDSLTFFCEGLGLKEVRRKQYEEGRFTLIFLATPDDINQFGTQAPTIELTYNWDPQTYTRGTHMGHLAFSVPNIYNTCRHLQDLGVTILRPPRDGYMAFIASPDGVSVELLQEGDRLPVQEPWMSMPNQGSW